MTAIFSYIAALSPLAEVRPGSGAGLKARESSCMMRVLGAAMHTFTVVGRCERTGHLGICLTSSPPSVAARCVFIGPSVGAVATQAFAHPGLGPLALKLLQFDYRPPKVLSELRSNDAFFEYRQIGILDRHGTPEVFTGAKNLEWCGHLATENLIAMGNYLVNDKVVPAMVEAFEFTRGEILEERLLRALEAGKAEGGEKGGQLSAGLTVYGHDPYPRTDLRVDLYDRATGPGDDAVSELRRIFEVYRPLIPYYELRPHNPLIGSWREWLERHSGTA